MSSTLKLTFLTAGSKTKVISVPSPFSDLDDSAVNNLMDAVVSSDAFSSDSGDITGKIRAQVVTTETQAFNLQ